MDSAAAESIRVSVRVRPVTAVETTWGQVETLSVRADPEQNAVFVTGPKEQETFSFDHVAGERSTQEEIFRVAGRPTTDNCLRGYNGTIIAYGQTGSGKTFTMFGPLESAARQSSEVRGVIPRCLEHLFAGIQREQKNSGGRISYTCRISYVEIYHENVYDLLGPNGPAQHLCQLREDSRRGVFVDGAVEEVVSSADAAYSLLLRGAQARRVGSTAMNHESSRSHSVCTIFISSSLTEDGMTSVKEARLCLVDLAGSERQRDTHATGSRLKEGSSINKALSTLSNVIHALSTNRQFIHYRDSKLTFLLRDSLGGNAKTHIIANISPVFANYSETLSTLRFAQRAKLIKNKVSLNENTTAQTEQLREQNRLLKLQIAQLEQSKGSLVSASAPDELQAQLNDLSNALVIALEKRKVAEKGLEDHARLYSVAQSNLDMARQQLRRERMVIRLRNASIDALKPGAPPSALKVFADRAPLEEAVEELHAALERMPEMIKHAVDAEQLRVTMAEKDRLIEIYANFAAERARQEDYQRQLSDHLIELKAQLASASAAAAAQGLDGPMDARTRTQVSDLRQRLAEETRIAEELSSKYKALVIESESHRARAVELEVELESARKLQVGLQAALDQMRASREQEVEGLNMAIETLRMEKGASANDAGERAELQRMLTDARMMLAQRDEELSLVRHKAVKAESRARRASDAFAQEHMKRNIALEAEKHQLEKQLGDAAQRLSERDRAVENLEQELTDLQGALEQGAKDRSDLEAELLSANSKMGTLEQRLDEAASKEDELATQVQSLQDELTFHTARGVEDGKAILGLTGTIQSLEGQLKAALERVSHAEQDMRSLREERSDGTAQTMQENQRLREELWEQQEAFAAQSEALNKATAALGEATVASEEAWRECDAAKEVAERLSEEAATLRASFAEQLARVEADARAAQSAAKAEIAAMRDEAADAASREGRLRLELQAAVRQRDDVQAQMTSTLERCRDMEEHLTMARADAETASGAASDTIQRLSEEVAAKAAELQAAQKRAAQLQATLEQMQESSKMSAESTDDALNAIRRDLDRTIFRNNELETQASALASDLRNAELLIQQGRLDLKELQESADEAKHALLMERTALQQRTAAADRLQSQVSALQRNEEELSEARALLSRQSGKLATLEAECARLSKELALADGAKKDALSAHAELQSNLQSCREMESLAHARAEESETRLQQLREEHKRVVDAMTSSTEAIESLQNENLLLSRHNNSKQRIQHFVTVKKQNDDLQKQVADLQRQLAEAQWQLGGEQAPASRRSTEQFAVPQTPTPAPTPQPLKERKAPTAQQEVQEAAKAAPPARELRSRARSQRAAQSS